MKLKVLALSTAIAISQVQTVKADTYMMDGLGMEIFWLLPFIDTPMEKFQKQKALKGEKVHVTSWLAYPFIADAVKKDKSKKVVVGGHSMGCWAATAVANMSKGRKVNSILCYDGVRGTPPIGANVKTVYEWRQNGLLGGGYMRADSKKTKVYSKTLHQEHILLGYDSRNQLEGALIIKRGH